MMKKPKDKLRIRYFSLFEFISIFLILMLLSALPAIMYGGGSLARVIQNEYVLWYMLYWLIITGIICAITAYQKYRSFSVPLKRLSEATKAVAQGDFSIYIEPVHTLETRNYIDLMFLDFNRMVKELGSIETLKNDFISNVSHELKTPLAIIQNYVTLLQNPFIDDACRQEYLQIIHDTTDKLTNLITNILRLNKLENQEIIIAPSAFDLCRQLSTCILGFEAMFDAKQLLLEVVLEDKAMIKADEELLAIVWNNILSNAIKFSEAHGVIRIKQTLEADAILVSISDTGCGMSRDVQLHIFEKFYQGDTSHMQQGNGLGLALVQRIIEKQGGTISVVSEVGKGSEFYIRLKR